MKCEVFQRIFLLLLALLFRRCSVVAMRYFVGVSDYTRHILKKLTSLQITVALYFNSNFFKNITPYLNKKEWIVVPIVLEALCAVRPVNYYCYLLKKRQGRL